MCAACVAQGIGYVGTALASLQVMGARAKARRRSSDPSVGEGELVDGLEVDDGDVREAMEEPAGV